ncbi:hypothetical protein L218DRAFT_882400, partial [Marasmius fiardii PR-910]
PDKSLGGSGAGQQSISENPMSVILNLGMSSLSGKMPPGFLETLSFPAETMFDYICVYQREAEANVGCGSKDYPTVGLY